MEQMITTETKNIVYTEKEIAEDIDFFIRSVEEVAPFPYMNADSLAIQALAMDLKKKGDRPGKTLYLDFMQLAAAFNVDHIYTFNPELMLDEAQQNGDIFFPLFLDFNKGSWQILGVIENAIPEENIGNEIKSINGIAINNVVNRFLPLIADETEKEKIIGRSMPFFLWAADFNAPFAVEIIDKETGSINRVELEGAKDLSEFRTQNTNEADKKLEDFVSFEWMENNIGYINAKSFFFGHNKKISKAFSKELDTYFASLQDKGIKNIIIDLRENSGGSGFPAKAILDRIAQKPYQQSGGSTMRVSKQFTEFIEEMPWAIRVIVKKGQLKNYYKHPVGANFTEESKPSLPEKVKNSFSGQVYVLIGPNTHSAAMMMANAIEDFDLGILVGEPTVSIPRELSNALPLKTPNAQISFLVPATLFTRASGDVNNFEAVNPDVKIETMPEDIRNNHDPVMQYVLEKIAANK